MVSNRGEIMAIKDLPTDEYILKGHAACPGCPATIALRITLKALGKKTILIVPACCSAVIQALHPHTAFNVPTLNIAFEASAAAASGVAAALKMLEKKDVLPVVWAGDGGSYDIGLQALSGALKEEQILFISATTTRCILILVYSEAELHHMEHGQQQPGQVKKSDRKNWQK